MVWVTVEPWPSVVVTVVVTVRTGRPGQGLPLGLPLGLEVMVGEEVGFEAPVLSTSVARTLLLGCVSVTVTTIGSTMLLGF